MPGSTTVDCLIDLVEEISTTLDRGDYAVTILLDLSKAFDTVNHSILLSKLTYYGILILLLGSDLIFIIESKEYSLMEFSLILCKFRLEYHEDRF